jgi:hypothetical protein
MPSDSADPDSVLTTAGVSTRTAYAKRAPPALRTAARAARPQSVTAITTQGDSPDADREGVRSPLKSDRWTGGTPPSSDSSYERPPDEAAPSLDQRGLHLFPAARDALP